MIYSTQQKIQNTLTRGVDEIIGKEELEKALNSEKKLRIKLGIDPTSSNIHLGRSIPLLKLRDFQDLGHKAILIVGDFTGTIGDTSDKDSERPMLSNKQIKENLKTYKKQIAKIIDISKAEFYFNSKWLKKLNFSEIGELASFFSINQFISRELISKRLKEGKRVSLHETLYPLMQGYDSLKIKADVELGGTDQRFNMLSGRDIQKHFKTKEQSIITTPIIEGLDGRKMSSSWGNTINFNDSPDEMFGKVMSMKDELIIKYFELLTRVSYEAIEIYKKNILKNPRDVKLDLAETITKQYHNETKAYEARETWKRVFSEKKTPLEIPKTHIKVEESLVTILQKNQVISSKTEFSRLIDQGAIKILENDTEIKVTDKNFIVRQTTIFKIGKKKFFRIIK